MVVVYGLFRSEGCLVAISCCLVKGGVFALADTSDDNVLEVDFVVSNIAATASVNMLDDVVEVLNGPVEV